MANPRFTITPAGPVQSKAPSSTGNASNSAPFDPQDGFFPKDLLARIEQAPVQPEPVRPSRVGVKLALGAVVALVLLGLVQFLRPTTKLANPASVTSTAPAAADPFNESVAPSVNGQRYAAPIVRAQPAAPITEDPGRSSVTAAAKAPLAPSASSPSQGAPAARSFVTHTRGTLPAAERKPVAAREQAPPTAATSSGPCAESLAALGLCDPVTTKGADR